MGPEDDKTPARTPSSIQRLTQWGITEAWLAQSDMRAVVLSGGPKGLRMTVIDPLLGEVIEDIGLTEDPSRAATRGIQKLQDRGLNGKKT